MLISLMVIKIKDKEQEKRRTRTRRVSFTKAGRQKEASGKGEEIWGQVTKYD